MFAALGPRDGRNKLYEAISISCIEHVLFSFFLPGYHMRISAILLVCVFQLHIVRLYHEKKVDENYVLFTAQRRTNFDGAILFYWQGSSLLRPFWNYLLGLSNRTQENSLKK